MPLSTSKTFNYLGIPFGPGSRFHLQSKESSLLEPLTTFCVCAGGTASSMALFFRIQNTFCLPLLLYMLEAYLIVVDLRKFVYSHRLSIHAMSTVTTVLSSLLLKSVLFYLKSTVL